jgi:hypothetical protein
MVGHRLCTRRKTYQNDDQFDGARKKTARRAGGFFAAKRNSHQALVACVVVVFLTVFEAHDLAVEFVYQIVYSCVQIGIGAFGKHVAAFDVNIALGFLAAFFLGLIFDAQEHTHINHLIKVPCDAIELVCDVTAQCGCDF